MWLPLLNKTRTFWVDEGVPQGFGVLLGMGVGEGKNKQTYGGRSRILLVYLTNKEYPTSRP